ncbi:MAG: hypothetical protein KDE27_16770 [Planctomycetes bacterium]|nr:hypothetical protein [Planctomycetota bacterium]
MQDSQSRALDMGVIVIVGDRFAPFASRHDQVLTYQEFVSRFVKESKPARLEIEIGQGLSVDQRQRIARWVANSTGDVVGLPVVASRRLAHKHEPKNIMVSQFARLGPDSFVGQLMIDDRNEVLSDHQTGGHISGMAEIEAMRQAFLVIAEQFFIPEGDSSKRTVVTIRKDITFHRFLFPLPAEIRFEIEEAPVGDSSRLRFHGKIEIVQTGQVCAEGNVVFVVFPTDGMHERELAQGRQALERLAAEGGAR